MPVKFINESDLLQYIFTLVYGDQNALSFNAQDLSNADFIETHSDLIAKALTYQWMKQKGIAHLRENKDNISFKKTQKTDILPVWALQELSIGNPVYIFDDKSITENKILNMTVLRDYLIANAKEHIENTLWTATQENKTPKIKLEYLKAHHTLQNYDDVLKDAQNWGAELTHAQEGTELKKSWQNGISIRQLMTPKAVFKEGDRMQNCLNDLDRGYSEYVKENVMQIYSLQDNMGKSHINFDVTGNALFECRGRNNVPDEKHMKYVREFIIENGFDIARNVTGIGLVKQGDTYYDIFNLPPNFTCSKDLDFSEHKKQITLPDNLSVRRLVSLQNQTEITELPKGLKVGGHLNLRNCFHLTALPDDLEVGCSVNLEGCAALKYIPPYFPDEKINGIEADKITSCKENWIQKNGLQNKISKGAKLTQTLCQKSKLTKPIKIQTTR